MAYGKRLDLSFADWDGTALIAEIHQDGYGGSSSTMEMGPEPIVMRWGGERWKNIIGSECTLQIWGSDDLSWLNTSDETEIKVIIKRGGSVWWTGFGVADEYTEQLNFPRIYTLTANDRLGMLDKFDYVDGSDLPYEGFESAIVILAQALAFTEVLIDLHSADNLFDTGMNTAATDDPLEQFSVNQDVIIDDDLNPGSCYDIIQYILGAKKLMLFQSAGTWWIYRVPNLENASMAYRVFNSSGVFQSNSSITHGVTTNKTSLVVLTGSALETAPSYKSILFVQDYHKKTQPFLGWNFPLNEFVSTTVLKHWVNTTSPVSGWEKEQYGDNYLIVNFFGPNSLDLTKNIVTPNIPVDADSQRLLKFKFASTGLGPVSMRVLVTLFGGSTYSIQSDGSWITPPGNHLELTPPVGSVSNLTEFSLLCDVPPEAGNVIIAFPQPFSANANRVWVDDVEFSIVPNPFAVSNYPETATFELAISDDNSIELTYYQNLNDTPISNDETEYTGFLFNITSDLYTSSWQEDGIGTSQTLQLWLREFNSPAGLFAINRFRGQIRGSSDFHKTLILTEGSGDTFVWEDVTYDLRSRTWDGSAIQLEGVFLAGDERSSGASGSNRGRPSTTGGPGGGDADPAAPDDRRSGVGEAITTGDNTITFSSPFPVGTSYTLRVLIITDLRGSETRGTISNKGVASFDINIKQNCTLEYDALKIL